ncbi:T9SS type A sorting domain-containing protein [Kaistella sp.]|uniref:T9SS type A sorting domain-containing protein n=1 Tax=Kaistella sp. TaxID=2782235 RepID=UPI003C5065D0
MKKIYLLTLGLLSFYGIAQQTISFEPSEGYVLGNIHGQNGWTVTEATNGLLTNQIITDEVSKSGYSFKNAEVTEYNPQWFPIFGAEKSFSPSFDYKNTTISYDFYSGKQMGADFEFSLYNKIDENLYDILLSVGFENRGYIYLFTEKNFEGFVYADPKWKINTWYNMKIAITEDTITYYLDDVEFLTTPNTSKVNIDGLTILHNNYGGDAYYDNIKINNSLLAVDNVVKEKATTYPSPVIDLLNIQLPMNEKISTIEVYSIAGQKVLSSTSEKEINLKSLKAGIYLVKTTSLQGKIYTAKIIKK